MAEVKVIKASKDKQIKAGRKLERIRVAAYCRVSTDDEDQMNSYRSQVRYYTEMIAENPSWQMTDVYADAAITGTKVDKREGFQRMISDCLDGKIDQIITKSISRFARNTVDTLKYVRLLKEKNIAVIFEDENINTMTMDGELLLTILSSVAQQEVENKSANVKKGLKMKMQRGELVGFNGCFGYDYDPVTKSISVNELERPWVVYIFDRYIQGLGCKSIARELKAKGVVKRDGTIDWKESGIRGMIENVKYKGDLIMGATFTADPISKRRLKNLGEEDMYYIENHHEPIISKEVFDLAQEIKEKRAGIRVDGRHEIAYKRYAFSGVLRCGYCGRKLSRKSIHGNQKEYKRFVWMCITYTKEGKQYCPKCKAIRDEMLKGAFVECYQILCRQNRDLVDNAIDETFDMLSNENIENGLSELRKKLSHQKLRKERLLDRALLNSVSDETFDKKTALIDAEINNLKNRIKYLEDESKSRDEKRKQLKKLKKEIHEGGVITKFSRGTFESLIQEVIVGGYDMYGDPQPHKLTFILKTDEEITIDGRKHAPQRKNAAGCCYDEIVEIFHFDYYSKHFKFDKCETGMRKKMVESVHVLVAIPHYPDPLSTDAETT